VWQLLKATYFKWSADRAARLAAALAYYTTLSFAPILLVVIGVGGLVFGREAVQHHLLQELATFTGYETARAIEDVLADASRSSESGVSSVVGLVAMMLGAAGVAWQLKDALNTIWNVRDDADATTVEGMRAYVKAVVLVIGIGFVLLVSLAISAGIAAASGYLRDLLPGSDGLWVVVHFAAALAVVTVLFALMFKWLPDADVRWSDVWLAAFVTSIFFNLGKIAVGFYLGRAAVASAYGAAGSFVILLIWIYYAAQILFFGAEFTQVYAKRRAASLPASP
jgi:membrane protein